MKRRIFAVLVTLVPGVALAGGMTCEGFFANEIVVDNTPQSLSMRMTVPSYREKWVAEFLEPIREMKKAPNLTVSAKAWSDFVMSQVEALRFYAMSPVSSREYTDIALDLIELSKDAGFYQNNRAAIETIAFHIQQDAIAKGLRRADIQRLKDAIVSCPVPADSTKVAEVLKSDWGPALEDKSLEVELYRRLGLRRTTLTTQDYVKIETGLIRNSYLDGQKKQQNLARFVDFTSDTLKDIVAKNVESSEFATVCIRIVGKAARLTVEESKSSWNILSRVQKRNALREIAPIINREARNLGLTKADSKRIIQQMTKWTLPLSNGKMEKFIEPQSWDWGPSLDELAAQ